MIVSCRNNFVFVKTRKTAGSTLEKLVYKYLGESDVCTGSTRDGTPALNIAPDQNGHMLASEIKQRFCTDDWWNQSYKFSIERNPWDKVVSSYYWHQKIKPQQFEQMSFIDYLKTAIPLLPIDAALYEGVDKVYKYENMMEMYNELNDMFGFTIDEEQVSNTKLKSNIRKVMDYKELHTPETIDIVYNLFKPTIDKLEYTYD